MTKLVAALFAAVTFSLLASAGPASAIDYPWCAQYMGGEMGGGRNCGFETIEQCRATVSGIGGFGEHNHFYQGAAVREPVKRRHKARND